LEDSAARRAERQAKRKTRLEQGAKRLRERAAELRKRAASGETAQPAPNSKRPQKSLEEQAQRLEEQANKMEARSKNLDEGRPGGAARASHQRRRSQLNRRWGKTLRDPDAIAELRVHAERSAKLKRVRSLALESNNTPVVERATKLLSKEDERHEKRMKSIQERSEASAGASSAPGQDPK
jgi:hypothetical protein